MTTNTSPDAILQAARELQEQKLSAVQRLIASRGYIADLSKQLADAERQDASAYQEAVKGGWSEAELKLIGLTPPARKPVGRPRGRSAAPRGGELGGSGAFGDAQLQREAAASVRLDGETHVVGDPS